MRNATIEARRRAIIAAKWQLQRQGLKPAHMPKRAIVALADDYFAKHRDELVCAALERFAQREKP